ncbi:hypothetical protein FQR65_LT09069 [Abscondita terminalis]|nr:hypothetical protein FQR65_LT09069 [Abscondita terminalis]
MDLYYILLDKEKTRVSICWKGWHIFMLMLVVSSGFATTHYLGKGLEGFGNNCILYADIVFFDANNTRGYTQFFSRNTYYRYQEVPTGIKPLDFSKTEWNSINFCYFCQFMPLISTLSGIIWTVHFLIYSRGGTGDFTDTYSRPWRVVYPAIGFAILIAVLMFVSSSFLYEGLNAFCAEFYEVFNTTT